MMSNPSSVAEISSVHPDIIRTHILTRLDGPTLASAACASSHLHELSYDDTLWRKICNQTWPSTADPRLSHVIALFPSGHRSFYSDSFPSLHHAPSDHRHLSRALPLGLISAVDLHYQNRLILSKVQHTDTKTKWFMSSPFRVDILDPKETVQTGVQLDTCLDKNFLLSWILIDQTTIRAANFASLQPVSVSRHWLTGDLHVRFTTVISDVQCAAVVTCKGEEGGDICVKEVSFVVEDLEGRSLNGEESLLILQDGMANGERRRRGDGEEERDRYDEYLAMKKEKMERKDMKERRMDMVCVSTVVTLVITWAFFLFKIST